MNKKIISTLSIFCILMLFISCQKPAVSRVESETIDASEDPLQENISDDQSFSKTTKKGTFTIKPVADYRIAARVVGTESYSRGWESSLSPIDLALAWGELANSEYDRYISYSQRGRWYYYRYTADCPFDNNYIINHSCNNHIIPASENLRLALKTINTGDLIVIEGCLVNIDGVVDGRKCWWNTSTSRSDSGDHSCEIIYAEKIRIYDKVYQ
jgi:hypothetical protein